MDRVPVLKIGDILLVSIQIDMEDQVALQLQEDLAELLGPAAAAAVQVVDIEGDPELEGKYGTRIPVLLADGEFVCAYRLDAERVQAYLSG